MMSHEGLRDESGFGSALSRRGEPLNIVQRTSNDMCENQQSRVSRYRQFQQVAQLQNLDRRGRRNRASRQTALTDAILFGEVLEEQNVDVS